MRFPPTVPQGGKFRHAGVTKAGFPISVKRSSDFLMSNNDFLASNSDFLKSNNYFWTSNSDFLDVES